MIQEDFEAKIIEAKGPLVLAIMSDYESARVISKNLHHQYKDLIVRARQDHLQFKDGKEIWFISASPLGICGRYTDDILIHPRVYDLPNIDDILAALAPRRYPETHTIGDVPRDEINVGI